MWIRFIVVGTVFIVLACWLFRKTPVRASARMVEEAAIAAATAEREENDSRPQIPPEQRKEMVESSLRRRKLKKGDSLRSIMRLLAMKEPSLHSDTTNKDSDCEKCPSGDSESEGSPSSIMRKSLSESDRSNVAGSDGSIFSSVRSISRSLSGTLLDKVGANISGGRQECTICLQGYQEGDSLSCSRYEGCKHVFHSQCIESWLAMHDDCPLCRTSIVNLPEEDSSST